MLKAVPSIWLSWGLDFCCCCFVSFFRVKGYSFDNFLELGIRMNFLLPSRCFHFLFQSCGLHEMILPVNTILNNNTIISFCFSYNCSTLRM